MALYAGHLWLTLRGGAGKLFIAGGRIDRAAAGRYFHSELLGEAPHPRVRPARRSRGGLVAAGKKKGRVGFVSRARPV